jgi:hypothetical protein
MSKIGFRDKVKIEATCGGLPLGLYAAAKKDET